MIIVHWSIVSVTISWDITPCSQFKISHHFGGTCCLHLQGQTRKGYEADSKQSPCVPRKRHLISGRLCYVVSEKVELFVITTVRTLNPTYCIFMHLTEIVWRYIKRLHVAPSVDLPGMFSAAKGSSRSYSSRSLLSHVLQNTIQSYAETAHTRDP